MTDYTNRGQRVHERATVYSVYIYDKGMGAKNDLLIAALPKDKYSYDDAVLLHLDCQEAWDSKDFDYVNEIRKKHGTL